MRAKYTRYLWYGAGCIVILMMAWIVASPSTKHSIVRKIEEFTHPSRHTIITPDNQIIHVNRAERSENIHTTYQKHYYHCVRLLLRHIFHLTIH